MPGSLGTPGAASFILVVDSWPVMEWLKNREPAASGFQALVESAREGKQILLMSTINLSEIYYNCWNEWNEARAEDVLQVLERLPVHMLHPTQEDALAAARIKGRYKLAYADAFGAVLAMKFNAP